jgi:hypothetical protein
MQDEPTMMDPQFYSLFDKGRQLDFEGYLLASATSYTNKKPRWFVVSIYKTLGGKYIVSGMGRSDIVHRPDCSQMKDNNPLLRLPETRSVQCDTCRPNLHEKVVHEVNREWAQVSDDPKAIIERLRLKDSDGVWYIPTTSLTALLEAAEKDEGIKFAFYTPQHIE